MHAMEIFYRREKRDFCCFLDSRGWNDGEGFKIISLIDSSIGCRSCSWNASLFYNDAQVSSVSRGKKTCTQFPSAWSRFISHPAQCHPALFDRLSGDRTSIRRLFSNVAALMTLLHPPRSDRREATLSAASVLAFKAGFLITERQRRTPPKETHYSQNTWKAELFPPPGFQLSGYKLIFQTCDSLSGRSLAHLSFSCVNIDRSALPLVRRGLFFVVAG